MLRSEFIRGAALAAALPFAGSFAPGGVTVERPNIVLFITDDQPFRSMVEMPKTLAALGQAGTTFPNSYAAVPRCGPNRASMLTGLYPHSQPHKNGRAGVFRNENATKRFRDLELHRNSVGYHLAQAGYRWGYYGKWLNDHEETPSFVPPGCDDFIGTFFNRDPDRPVKANVRGTARKTNKKAWEETGWVGQNAARFILESSVESSGAPFFCVASFQGPHDPYAVSPANRDIYDNVPMWRGDVPDNFDHPDPEKPHNRGPLSGGERADLLAHWRGKMGELRDVDDAVAEVCAAIDWNTTYAFFTSDNGWLLGEHRLVEKNEPYEESVRVPLLARGPAVQENATPSALVSTVDLAPTFYELAGLDDLAAQTDGRSLLGHMVGADAAEGRDYLLIEEPHDVANPDKPVPGWASVRTEGALYAERHGGARELYDMDADPHQLENIASGADGADLYDLSERLGALRGVSGEELRAEETR